MNAIEVLSTVLGALVAIDLIAWRWGSDSREGREWEWRGGADLATHDRRAGRRGPYGRSKARRV